MLKYVAIIVLSSILFVGCVMQSSAPLTGVLYTNVTHAGMATTEQDYSKTGKAKCSNILGLVSTGDCSIEKAKKDGRITAVSSVDYNSKSYFFGIYQSYEVIVTGK